MPRAKKAKPSAKPSAKPKRTRADGRQITTRQRLIDTTIDIVRAEGAGALTTGRIANGAGIQQPGFYVHFKNVDECLHAAADQVSSYMVDTEVKMRRERALVTPEGERLTETVERMKSLLALWMDNVRFAELMVRCRNDSTALGESCRAATARSIEALREDLWDMATQYGVRGRYLKDIELMSALLVTGFLAALELLISGAYKDVSAVATALGRSQHAYVRAEIRRMLQEQAAQSAQATR